MERISIFHIMLWFVAIIVDKFLGIPFLYYIVATFITGVEYKKNKSLQNIIINLLLYSIIFPDNYFIIIIIYIAWFFIGTYIFKKISISIVIIIFTILLNSIINEVPVPNILMTFLYFIPTIFLFDIIKKIYKNKVHWLKLKFLFSEVIVIQCIATAVNLIKHLIVNDNNPDWSSGTMRQATTYILMLIMAFTCIRLLFTFLKKRSNKELIWFFITLYCTISASCETLFYIIAASVLVFITIKEICRFNIHFLVISIVIGAIGWYGLMEVGDIQLILSSKEYREIRVSKISAYEDVYFNYPKENFKYAIIGRGPGYGASRAAVISTGQYIDAYNLFFPVSKSEFTDRYIYSRMPYVNGNHNSILNMPYASSLSIMGDFGYSGVLIFLTIILILFRKSSFEGKILLVALIASCFVDFTLEYSKVMLVFWINWKITNESKFIVRASNLKIDY